MILTLYKNQSAENVINKTLVKGPEITFNFKTREVDVLNPSLLLSNLSKQGVNGYDEYNYAKIDKLNRYYFISNIEVISSNFVRISLEVDVLETYKDAILATTAVVKVPAKDGMFGEVEVSTTGRIINQKFESDVELKPANTLLLSTIGR